MHNNSGLKTLVATGMMTGLATTAFAMVLTVLSPHPIAFAQENQLEEVLVTARKRSESLQNTPISVVAFSAQDLAARSMENIRDISEFTPNLTFNNATEPGGANSAQVFIRGVGQQDYLIVSDPGVGVYMDGVYLGRATGGALDITDVAQIEVLRGPQGTLYGRNTIGGAINIVPNKPTAELGGSLEVIIGSDQRYEFNGVINAPLSDTVLTRLAAHWRDRDGFGESNVTGQEFGNDDDYSLLGQIAFELSDEFSARLSADYRKQDTNPSHAIVLGADPDEFVTVPGPGGNPIGLAGKFIPVGLNQIVLPQLAPDLPPLTSADDIIATDRAVNSANVIGRNESEVWGLALTVDYSGWQSLDFRSITAYRAVDVQFKADGDATFYDISEIDADISQWQFSQELQLSGGNDRIDWLVGGFYYKEDADDNTRNWIFRDRYTALENADINIITIPCAVAPIPGPPGCAGNPASFALDTNLLTQSAIDVTNIAAFLHAEYDLTDRFSVEAGIRYSYEEKEFTNSLTRLISGIPAVPEATIDDDWSSVSPRLGVNFKPTEDVLLYLSATRGFKSGSFNGRSLSQGAIQPVDPEEILTYEAGLKSVVMDGRIRFNAAIFYNDYEDVQLQFVETAGGNVAVQYDNAGDAEIYGAEVELLARISPNFQLSVAGSYADAELTEVDEDAAAAGFVEGTQPSKTPEYSFVASGEYTVNLANGGQLSARLDYSWVDDFYHQRNEDPLSFQESYEVLNARLSFVDAAERFELALFGTNLSDEDYFNTIVVGSTRIATGYPARERAWGLSAKLNF